MRLVLVFGSALAVLCQNSCSDNVDQIQPIVEVPDKDSDSYPYDAIDTLTLSIAHEGSDSAISLDTSRVGDPLRLSSVSFGERLVVHLSGSLGNEELAYGRTCAVDFLENGDGSLAPHLYFSRLVRWGRGPELVGTAASALLGVVVQSQGIAVFLEPNSADVRIVDPISARGESVSRTLDARVAMRSGATASPLGDAVIVVGGTDSDGNASASIEVIRPSEVTAVAQVRAVPGPALRGHVSVPLQDGSVLVAGGLLQASAGEEFTHSQSALVLSLLDGELRQREITAGLRVPRTGHSMTRLGNEVGADVLIVGGRGADGLAISLSELYRPLRSAFEDTRNGSLLRPRYNHRSVRLPGGFVLVIGGQTLDTGGQEVPVRELELYDPVRGEFSLVGTLPDNAGVVGMSVTELPDSRFLLAGGHDIAGTAVTTVLIARFDPIDGVVDLSPTASLAVPRSNHAAVRLCDGTVLVAGGSSASTASERYSPPSAGRR